MGGVLSISTSRGAVSGLYSLRQLGGEIFGKNRSSKTYSQVTLKAPGPARSPKLSSDELVL